MTEPYMTELLFIFNEGSLLLQQQTEDCWQVGSDEQLVTLLPPSSQIITVDCGSPDLHVRAYRTECSDSPPGYEWCGLRQSYYKLSPQLYQTAGKCSELLHWDRSTQYCGYCGERMVFHTAISKRCTSCGREIWPSPAVAVIVLVHRGDEVLLVHARNFKGRFFGLVAGFVETGENLEEAVSREVMEETGLTITNIRYFGSQPWPYPLGLMVGFHADYVSGDLKLQYEELEVGGWFTCDNLPTIPEKLSIARRIIDDWLSDEKKT